MSPRPIQSRSAKPGIAEQQRGAAVTELAICLPILFLIIFGSIEACNLITLKQIATQAAYDGTLIAVRRGSSESDITNSTTTVLNARGIASSTITIQGESGTPYASLSRGDEVGVTVELPANGNVVGPQLFSRGQLIEVELVGMKQ